MFTPMFPTLVEFINFSYKVRSNFISYFRKQKVKNDKHDKLPHHIKLFTFLQSASRCHKNQNLTTCNGFPLYRTEHHFFSSPEPCARTEFLIWSSCFLTDLDYSQTIRLGSETEADNNCQAFISILDWFIGIKTPN